MHEELPATPQSVARARHAVRRFAGGLEVDLEGVSLAVTEAVANAVAHAYPDGEHGTIEVSAEAAPFEVTVAVRDHGGGLAAGDGNPGAGFGLQIIERLAQHVALADSPDGVTLTMGFRRGGAWSGRRHG